MQHNFMYPNEYHIAQATPQKVVPLVGEGQKSQGKVKDSLISKAQARVCEIWQFHVSLYSVRNDEAPLNLWIK